MKELIIVLILTLLFSFSLYSQANAEEPEYYKGTNYPVEEESGNSKRCRDICQEIDENGNCIKVEVRCSD